ncbi:MAG: hypothetical protein ACQEVA_11460 [Myxococcota bacterium]
MSKSFGNSIARELSRVSREVAKTAGRSASDAAHAARTAGHAANVATKSQSAQNLIEAARATAASGPVKEVAKICGRAGAAGAIVDGGVGAINAAKYLRAGRIDKVQAAKHVGAEAGCGFVTSSAGTAGTIAVYMVTGAMGPAAMAAGMGASIGSRWLYRKVVGETLPSDEDDLKHEEDAVEESDVMEDIGPKPMD